jgi:hypothetical protein
MRHLWIVLLLTAAAIPAQAAKAKKKKPVAAKKAAVEQPASQPVAAAQPASQPAPAAAAPAPAVVSKPAIVVAPAPAPTPSGDGLDFDLLAPAPKLDQARVTRLEQQSKTRRTMLGAHLIVGYTLLGVLGATEVLGTLNYYDKFGGGGYKNYYDSLHEGFAIGSTVLFAAQAGLAIFAPDPYPKPGGWNSARFHRIAEILASVGMVTEIALGPISETRYGKLDERDFAVAHLVIGYVTYALVIGGVLAWLGQ